MDNKHLVEVTDVNLRQLHLCLQKSRDIQQQEDSGGGGEEFMVALHFGIL